jgi:hypothetical protein
MALFVETHYDYHRGECERGLACTEQALDAARKLGVTQSVGLALYIASLSYYTACDCVAVRRLTDELKMRAGQHEAAGARLEAWMPRIEACGIRLNEPALLHIAARIRRAVGDEAGALEQLRAAVELGIALDTYVHALRAALELWEIRPGSAEAREALERCLAKLVTGTTLPEAARARALLG